MPDDALFTDNEGVVSETSIANVGFARDGEIVWPSAPSQAEVRRQMADALLGDLERFARGRPVRHRVRSSMLERMT